MSDPTPTPRSTSDAPWGGWLPPALLLAGIGFALLFVHSHDMDAAIYTILARNQAADGLSLHLRFTPPGTLFFEHPPLWLWALALAARTAPGLPLGLASIPCGVATVWLCYRLGRRLVGVRAAQLGLLLLPLGIQVAFQFALPRLDAPLTLAFTASVALLVEAEGRAPWLLAGGLAAGLGTLVKGPPAFGAPIAAALLLVATGRGRELLRLRAWLWPALGAALPPALFLGWDAFVLGGEWARGYLDHQVLASLDGRRTSQFGHGPGYLLSAGLWARGRLLAPLALVALLPLLRRADPRRGPRLGLLLWIAVLVIGFGAAARAYWFYMLPAYPALALLAGAGLEDLLALLRPPLRERLVRALPALAAAGGLAIAGAGPFGAMRWAGAPCSLGDLPARAAARGLVGVVTEPSDHASQPLLAEHGRCEVARFLSVEAALARRDLGALLAPRQLPIPSGWREDGSCSAWALWVPEAR